MKNRQQLSRSMWRRFASFVGGGTVITALTGFGLPLILTPVDQWGQTPLFKALNWLADQASPTTVTIFFAIIWIGWLLRLLHKRKRDITSLQANVERIDTERDEQLTALRERLDLESGEHDRALTGIIQKNRTDSELLRDQLQELQTKLEDAVNRQALQIHHFRQITDRDKLLADAIKDAKNSILVVGVVNEVVRRLEENSLHGYFARSGRLKVLFIDPDGDEVYIRERLEREVQNRPIPHGDFADRTRSSINSLRTYRETLDATKREVGGKFGNHREQLFVRVYDRQPTLSLVLIDDKWAMFHYYGLSHMGYTTPTYVIDGRCRDDVYEILGYYRSEFECLWTMEGSRDWVWH